MRRRAWLRAMPGCTAAAAARCVRLRGFVCARRVTERASQLADNRDECLYDVTQEQVVNNTKTDVCSSACRGRHTQVKGLATC